MKRALLRDSPVISTGYVPFDPRPESNALTQLFVRLSYRALSKFEKDAIFQDTLAYEDFKVCMRLRRKMHARMLGEWLLSAIITYVLGSLYA